MGILDAGKLSIPDELVKEKNEIISKINDLQKEYSTLNLTDEEYEDLKKTLDEKLKKIEDEITPKNIEDEKKTLEEKHLQRWGGPTVRLIISGFLLVYSFISFLRAISTIIAGKVADGIGMLLGITIIVYILYKINK